MSTSEIFLTPAEIEEFVRETRIAPQYFYGYEGRELGLCPCVSFYVFHNKAGAPAVADAAIQMFEEFSQLIDEPWKLIFNTKDQEWQEPNAPALKFDMREEARRRFVRVKSFYLSATDAESPAESTRWAYSAVVDDDGSMQYTRVKLTFRYKWYQQNRARWHAFVERCVTLLQPEQCYSGFEIGNGGFNILGSYEGDVLERICADHFYGMDIDHPESMCFHSYRHRGEFLNPTNLGAGLRPPTWCFLLSPIWRHQLGLSEAQVREQLKDPRVSITAVASPVSPHNPQGEDLLWIRLGELSLYPVDEGLPDLLVKANALIRPIRCDHLRLNTLDPWDDDPNPRFDYQSSLDWVRRFDEDSQWPTPAARHPTPPQPVFRGRCEAGQPCPKAGFWSTPARAGSRQRFEVGQPMPEVGGDYGATIWQWDDMQG